MALSSSFRGINVYIGYSPADQPFLARLRIHLRPMETNGLIQVWEAASIPPGSDSTLEVERMITGATLALLLVSADFLASPDIEAHLLPLILQQARLHKLTILPIIVGYSSFQYSPLADYQPINDPTQPLKTLKTAAQEEIWLKVVQTFRSIQPEAQRKFQVVDTNQLLSNQSEEASTMPERHSEDATPAVDEAALEPLTEALLSAFPSQADLKLLISLKLMRNIEIIAAGHNLEERVHSLVLWAFNQGQLPALITAALARNPGNPKLRKFAASHGF